MSVEIAKENWTQFFQDVSKKRYAWETKIEVSSDTSGKQVLSNGLYLSGITFEEKSGTSEVEISVSKDTKRHQTHTVSDPKKIFYISQDKFHDSSIEIFDNDGILTTVHIFNPMPIMVGYAAYHSIAI